MKEKIYNIPELETIVFAEQNGTVLKLVGVFSKREITFAELIKFLPFQGIESVELGFMPCWRDAKFDMVERETDQFFARNIHCDLGDFKFPEMSFT